MTHDGVSGGGGVRALLGWGRGLCATVIRGSFYPVSRLLFGSSGESVEPMSYTWLRLVLASLFLSPLLVRREARAQVGRMVRGDKARLVGLSLLGIVGEGLLVFWSTKYTTGARSSLMANTSPITTLLLAWLAGRETLTGRKVAGLVLGFAGMALLFQGQGADRFAAQGASTLLGDAMAFGSGCCWAAFTVFGERFSREYGGPLSSLMMFAVSAALMLPVALVANGGSLPLSMGWGPWLGALYLGLFGGGAAIALWYTALRHVSPGRLGALGYVSAALATGGSVLLVGERLDWAFLAALGLVVGGVSLMMQSTKDAK